MDEQSKEVIQGAGCWVGMGFRLYIDTQMTDALEIPRLVTQITDSDSDDDKEGPSFIAAIDTLRSKVMVFPIGQKRAPPQD